MEPKSLFYFLLSERFTFFRSFPRLPIRGLYCQRELSSRPCGTLREMMGINKANVDCLRWKNCHVSKSALTVNNKYDWFMLTLAESFYTSRKTPELLDMTCEKNNSIFRRLIVYLPLYPCFWSQTTGHSGRISRSSQTFLFALHFPTDISKSPSVRKLPIIIHKSLWPLNQLITIKFGFLFPARSLVWSQLSEKGTREKFWLRKASVLASAQMLL